MGERSARDLNAIIPLHADDGRGSLEPSVQVPIPAAPRPPLFGSTVAAVVDQLWHKIEADPLWALRRGLYASTVSATLAAFFATAGAEGLAILAACGILIIWGIAHMVTYAVTEDSSFNPIAILLVVVGGGTALIVIFRLLL